MSQLHCRPWPKGVAPWVNKVVASTISELITPFGHRPNTALTKRRVRMHPLSCGLVSPLAKTEFGPEGPISSHLIVVPEGVVASLRCQCGATSEALICGPREESLPCDRPYPAWVVEGLTALFENARMKRWSRKHLVCENGSPSSIEAVGLPKELFSFLEFMAPIQLRNLPEEQGIVQVTSELGGGRLVIGAPTSAEGYEFDRFHLRFTQFVLRETLRQNSFKADYAILWHPRKRLWGSARSENGGGTIKAIVVGRQFGSVVVFQRGGDGYVQMVEKRPANVDESLQLAGMLWGVEVGG